MSIAKAATATAAELSSMTRRSSLTRRGSFMGKTNAKGSSSAAGSTATIATGGGRRASSDGGGGRAGRSAEGGRGGGGGGSGGGHTKKPSASARSAEASRKVVRDTVRAQAPREDGGFLAVDEYVVHLYDKYGEGGLLNKKAFTQVVAELLGDDGMTPTELDEAFTWFAKASGVQGAIGVDGFLEGVLMSDEERRETARKLREKIKKKFGKRDDQLRELFDFMAEPNRGDSASARALCEVVEEWLKVDIAEPEALSILGMMDLDRDGAVSMDDFMGFMGPQGEEAVEATSLAARLGSAIIDIEVSTSKEQEAELESNGYKVVDANVNAGTMGPPIHVWYRRLKHGGAGVRLKPLVDVVVDHKNVNSALVVDGYQCIDRSLNKPNAFTGTQAFRIASTLTDEKQKVELSKNVRRQIRQYVAPTEVKQQSTGPVDYAAIFNKHDAKGRGLLTRDQLRLLLKDVGLNLEAKDLKLLFGRIDHNATNGVSREEFLNFVSLTEDELDEVCDTLRRKYGAGIFSAAGVCRKEQIKGLRRRFAQIDEDGNGVLTRGQFSNMLSGVGVYLTGHEQELIKERFDVDGDGRIDLLNFLNFFLTRDRKERRSAARVTRALEAIREDALNKQADKTKITNADYIDSSTAWNDLKKCHVRSYKKTFPNYLTVDDIGQALERLNVRLSQRELHQLVMRLSPLGNGHVSEADFHHLVAFPSRDIGIVLKLVENDALPSLIEAYRRVRHCQHRKVFQETVALGATASTPFGGTFGPNFGATGMGGGIGGGGASCLGGTDIFRNRTAGSPSRLGRTAGGMAVGQSSALSPSRKDAVGGVSVAGTGAWDGDTEDPALRAEFTKKLEAFVKAIRPDDQDFTTIEHIRDGLSSHAGSKLDRDGIHETEWAHLAQLVGADQAEHNIVDAHAFLEGLCGECLEEHETTKAVTLEDIAQTEAEALNLVCEDLLKMIDEEARVEPIDDDNLKASTADGVGGMFDDSGDEATRTVQMDYSKPFRLFDEQGLGVIPVDKFRAMLYRLHVNSLLRERQVVALIDRFDVDRKGEITLEDFEAFAKKKTWGQDVATADPFTALLAATGNLPGSMPSGIVAGKDAPGAESPEADETDSDAENARFRGLRVSGSKRGDAIAINIASQLRKSFPNKPQDAKRELSDGLHALDKQGDKRLPPSSIVTALKRMGIELRMKQRDAEKALRVFEAEDTCSGRREVEFSSLVDAVGRAWRAEDLHSKQHSLTGNNKLDGKVVRLQREFRSISTTKFTNPKTGTITYSYKMGKVFRKLDEDGDGTLTSLEFKRGLRKLGIGDYLGEKDVRRIFRSFDRALSGSVDYHEFCDFLLHGAVSGKTRHHHRRHQHRANLYSSKVNHNNGHGYSSSGHNKMPRRRRQTHYRRHGRGGGGGGGTDDGSDVEYGYGYDSGSGDGLFEPPPDPVIDAARDAMVQFAPSGERQQRVRDYLRGKDKNASGKMPESKFHQFLRRSGVENTLGSDGTCALIERMDPRATGYIRYIKFLDKVFDKAKSPDDTAAANEPIKGEDEPKAADTTPILHRIQEAVLQSLVKNRPYHGLFRLSDDTGSGLVTLEALKHTLNMMGAKITQDEAQMHLCARPLRTPYSGGGALIWPPPAVLPSTNYAAGILGQGLGSAPGGGGSGVRNDLVLEEVASRVRQRVLEKTQLWGPTFSLSRQFEFHDPRNRGMVTVEDFSSVMEQLGVYLSGQETDHIRRLFDRYGDGAIDYTDFCQSIMFDRQEMEALAGKINSRFAELRRRGVDIRSAFDMYDLSKTGFVSRRDFREAMRKLKVPVTEHQLQSLCSRFGQLGDPDSISYEDLFFFVHSATPELNTTRGGRAAVDGNGYDGIRGAGSGPVLARDNVQRWYSGVASGEEKRLFDQVYGRLRRQAEDMTKTSYII
eukprot:jgi/Undpi1/12387/HiC_scaffold_5.g02059.m1